VVAGPVTAGIRRTPASDAPLERRLAPLLMREIAAIAAIDSAIAAERRPDYVVMYQGSKTGKQANVEQLATVIRRGGGIPPENGGLRKYILQTLSAITERYAGTTATLHAMRAAELDILQRYLKALDQLEGLSKHAVRKALGRAIVHYHLLTAHIAKRAGVDREAQILPLPLDRYFAGPLAKACMRCHLDRPGALPALERRDPHPYTYICAGCHVEVRGEFSPDLVSQMDRWPDGARQARVLQRALGRPSKLTAMYSVLYPLSGLVAAPPVRSAGDDASTSVAEPSPTSASDDTPVDVTVEPQSVEEAAYLIELFDYRSVRRSW
jgi:hypothetical protein